ncbi:MAG: AAA family ATPase, partial [bacterium]
MNLKLKKLLISNFKCVRGKEIIDLTESSLLSGPNGFGKTTIFDALEICFTGSLNRFNNYQIENRNTTFKDAFYQNEKNNPTILKVLLEKDGCEYALIQEAKSKEKSRPTDMPFSRFVEKSNEKDFQNKLLDFQNIQDSELEIDLERLKKNYLLFNYISQEEATYFLKKNQNDRRADIDILTNPDNSDIARKRENLETLQSKLNTVDKNLAETIEELSTTQTSNQVPYARLLSKSFNFDQENPFTNTAKLDNDLNTYLKEIKDLKTLRETFKPSEYKKYLAQESLNQLAENKSFLEYLILKPFFDLDLIKKIFPKLKNLQDQEIFLYLLDKLFTDIDKFKSYNSDLQHVWKYLKMSLDEKFKELEEFLNSISDIKIKNLIDKEAFIQDYTHLKSLQETASKGDAAVNKLINLRKQLLTEFEANPPKDM